MKTPTRKQRVGRLGEDIAMRYLEDKGFSIIECNYRKKYGEIDIIANKNGIIHFVEVKSVSHENFVSFLENSGKNVPHETDRYRPEDNVHPYKLKRLARTIQVYLLEKFVKQEQEWQFDVITVRIDIETKRAKIELLDNLIL